MQLKKKKKKILKIKFIEVFLFRIVLGLIPTDRSSRRDNTSTRCQNKGEQCIRLNPGIYTGDQMSFILCLFLIDWNRLDSIPLGQNVS